MKYQISNIQYQIFNKKSIQGEHGFTLIELLVVMIAFMVTGTVIASVIFTHVKAIDKTNTETAIRQAGNSIISQISKDIRNAGAIRLKDTAGNDIGIQQCVNGTNYDVLYTNQKLISQNESSYQCISPNIRRHIVDGSNVSTELLVDQNVIIVNNCTFTCQVTPGTLPVITVSFTLEEKTTSAKSKSIGDKVSIPFTTSVQMRNTN